MHPSILPAFAVAVVIALTATPVQLTSSGSLGSPGAPISSTPSAGVVHAFSSLTVGASVGLHYANPFFAISYGETGISPVIHANQGFFYNTTPLTWYRLSGGGDGYDPTTQTNWVPPASGSGNFVGQTGQLVNFSAFQAWCYSRTPHCDWMSYLPAEENDTAAAVHYVNWYHKVLGFAPTLWQFGNEPTAWTHYGINSTSWKTSDASTPTNEDYAIMVKDYIAAISAVYPHDKFVGVEAACACDPTFLTAVAATDGPKVTALAYHEFPQANASSSNLAQFYGSLTSASNILNTSAHFRSIVGPACVPCARLPVQIGAYQAGPSGNLSPLANTYAGAPYAAASVIEALDANISMFTMFQSNSLYNASSGTIFPQGYLYQRILDNLTMGTDYPVTFSVHSVGGLFGIEIKNGTHTSLLLVNTNVSLAVGISLTATVFPVGLTGTAFTWSPTTATPVVHSSILIPKYLVLPAQAIVLLNNY